MRSLLAVIAFTLSFSAHAETEIFQLPVTVSLSKLTANTEYPGTVNGKEAPGSGKQTVSVPLAKCETWGGAEHCSGYWQTSLKMDDVEYFYFANVYNQTGSDKHSIVLLICTEKVKQVEECKRWISNQIDFKGKVPPHVALYDSGHSNLEPAYPATFQPRIDIGDAD